MLYHCYISFLFSDVYLSRFSFPACQFIRLILNYVLCQRILYGNFLRKYDKEQKIDLSNKKRLFLFYFRSPHIFLLRHSTRGVIVINIVFFSQQIETSYKYKLAYLSHISQNELNCKIKDHFHRHAYSLVCFHRYVCIPQMSFTSKCYYTSVISFLLNGFITLQLRVVFVIHKIICVIYIFQSLHQSKQF